MASQLKILKLLAKLYKNAVNQFAHVRAFPLYLKILRQIKLAKKVVNWPWRLICNSLGDSTIAHKSPGTYNQPM